MLLPKGQSRDADTVLYGTVYSVTSGSVQKPIYLRVTVASGIIHFDSVVIKLHRSYSRLLTLSYSLHLFLSPSLSFSLTSYLPPSIYLSLPAPHSVSPFPFLSLLSGLGTPEGSSKPTSQTF